VGPVIILDKSTFQSLSRREHVLLHKHFTENLTPILAMELLGDLAKQPKRQRRKKSAESQVSEIAGKFGGSGPVTNVDYLTLVYTALLGAPVPTTGQIIPENVTHVQGPGGSRGALIGPSAFNRALLQWSGGRFSEFERELADYWRQITKGISLDAFRSRLDTHHITLPHVEQLEHLTPTADGLLATHTLQDAWLEWLLGQLSLPAPYERAICARWRSRISSLLRDFAPYAWFVLRATLVLLLATRYNLVRWRPTSLLDVQYLYYLPFCMVFASGDLAHQALAPLLLRPDQSFVAGDKLKADLRRLVDELDHMDDRHREMLSFALGVYPTPARGSVVYNLWKKHMRPWGPGSGNRATSLSSADQEEAIRWVEQMVRDAETAQRWK